jgi:hypothetical protein
VNLFKLAPLALLTLGMVSTVACFTGKDDTGETEGDTDADADADSDTDADSDSDADTDLTGTYEGFETFDYYYGPDVGSRACSLRWDASGTPITPCSGCDWAFNVAMTYDSGASTDDGSCASLAGDASYGYGYMADYYGYGAYLMYQYGSAWYAWAGASFGGGTFTYETGTIDYPWDYYGHYPGYYLTNMWAGEAAVTQ